MKTENQNSHLPKKFTAVSDRTRTLKTPTKIQK